MPAGFLVVNNAGSVLIDENYANLAMRVKGSGSTSGSPSQLAVALSGLQSPMVAWASTTFTAMRYMASDLSQMIFRRDGTGATNIDWFVFDQPTVTGTQGLQIYNAAGVLVFDSGNKYARVVDIFGGAAEADWVPTRTYPAGRTYAVVELKKAYRKESTNLGGGNWHVEWFTSAMRVVANAVTGKMIKYKEDDVTVSPTGIVTDNSAQFAVLDVTGY